MLYIVNRPLYSDRRVRCPLKLLAMIMVSLWGFKNFFLQWNCWLQQNVATWGYYLYWEQTRGPIWPSHFSYKLFLLKGIVQVSSMRDSWKQPCGISPKFFMIAYSNYVQNHWGNWKANLIWFWYNKKINQEKEESFKTNRRVMLPADLLSTGIAKFSFPVGQTSNLPLPFAF